MVDQQQATSAFPANESILTDHGERAGTAVEVAVIVPVKDEIASLQQLVTEVSEALNGRRSGEISDNSWELIIVDDGSRDGTWDEIMRLSADNPRVRGLRLRRNFGKSAALAAGLEASSGRIVVTLDGDLQDDPSEIPNLIARLGDPADLVTGHKQERKDPFTKRLPSRIFNFCTNLATGLKLHDHNCGLKVGRREVFTSVPLYGEMHRYVAAISHAQGFVVVEQPVRHRPRKYGSSKFGLERYLRGGLDLLTVITLTRYRRRPAHLFGGLGVTIGAIGVLILTYLSMVWFFTDQGIGDRPLLLLGVLLVVLGVQLVSLGLLAEMVVNREAAEESSRSRVAATTDSLSREKT